MPHWGALGADVIGRTQLSDLVAALVLLHLNEGLKLLVGGLVAAFAACLLLAVILRIHDIVHLVAIFVLKDLVAVHVVEDLLALSAHVVVHLHLSGLIIGLGFLTTAFGLGCLCRLVVHLEGERELGELDIGVEVIEALEVGAVLPLRLRLVTAGEDVLGAQSLRLHPVAL